MRKNCYQVAFLLFVAVFLSGVSFSKSCFAVDVTVGGDVELVYSGIRIDDTVTQDKTAKFNTTCAAVTVKAKIDENTNLFIKLDVDDFVDGVSGISNDSLLEEAKFTFDNLLGTVEGTMPLSVIAGKQELPFGLDKDIVISDTYTHNSGTGTYLNGIYDFDGDGTADKINHFGEVDNKFGIVLVAKNLLGETTKDSSKVELCVFQNDRGQDTSNEDEKPRDNGLSQSYAVKLTSKRVANLEGQVSFISMHKEGLHSTAGKVDNSEALSFSFDYSYKVKDANDPQKDVNLVELFAEAIVGYNLENVKDYDQNIYSFGLVVTPVKNVDVIAEYNGIIFKDNIQDVTPKLVKYTITPTYKLDNGVQLALEYAKEVLDTDSGADDITADVISARVAYKF